MIKFIAGAILIVNTILVPSAQAQQTENCGDILRYASRNITSSVSFADLRKYYYSNVCSSNQTGLGISFKDATDALGLTYSNKDDYCRGEKSFDSSNTYSRQDASLVVNGALTAYVQCRTLSSQGINTYVSIPPADTPTVFSIGISRSSANPVTITAVRIDRPSAVNCAAVSGNKTTEMKTSLTRINVALPQSDDRWSLTCSRVGQSVTDGTSFDPVQVILSTTRGDFPFSLVGGGLAANNWAQSIKDSIAKLDSETKKSANDLVSNLKKAGATHNAGQFNYEISQCPAGQYLVGLRQQLDSGGPHGITSWLAPICRDIL